MVMSHIAYSSRSCDRVRKGICQEYLESSALFSQFFLSYVALTTSPFYLFIFNKNRPARITRDTCIGFFCSIAEAATATKFTTPHCHHIQDLSPYYLPRKPPETLPYLHQPTCLAFGHLPQSRLMKPPSDTA